MPSKLPRLAAKAIIRILERKGFVLARQSGSHKIYINSEKKRATIPFHGDKILHPKILKSIIEDAGISEKELKG